jgi:hypothetical protein
MSNPTDPEICIVAALQLPDGRIIRGHRASDCVRTAANWLEDPPTWGALSGFITSRNRFVDREEANRVWRRL